MNETVLIFKQLSLKKFSFSELKYYCENDRVPVFDSIFLAPVKVGLFQTRFRVLSIRCQILNAKSLIKKPFFFERM